MTCAVCGGGGISTQQGGGTVDPCPLCGRFAWFENGRRPDIVPKPGPKGPVETLAALALGRFLVGWREKFGISRPEQVKLLGAAIEEMVCQMVKGASRSIVDQIRLDCRAFVNAMGEKYPLSSPSQVRVAVDVYLVTGGHYEIRAELNKEF